MSLTDLRRRLDEAASGAPITSLVLRVGKILGPGWEMTQGTPKTLFPGVLASARGDRS